MENLFCDQQRPKQKTYLFLLSPVALSIYTLKIGGNGVAGTKTSGNGGSEASHISTPFKIALNKLRTLTPQIVLEKKTLAATLNRATTWP